MQFRAGEAKRVRPQNERNEVVASFIIHDNEAIWRNRMRRGWLIELRAKFPDHSLFQELTGPVITN